MLRFFALAIFFLSPSAFSYEILQEYRALGLSLGKGGAPEKVCGPTSKTLNASPGKDAYEIVDCQSTQLKVKNMVVAHLKGLPVQVSAQYGEGETVEPLKTEGTLILEDAKESTGVRTIKGVLPTNLKKKMSASNLAAFLVFVNDEGKVGALTVTDCAKDFAEKAAKGQYESCKKGREKLK